MAELTIAAMVATMLAFAGAALAFVFAAILLRVGVDSPLASRLVWLLLADGSLMAAIGLDLVYAFSGTWDGLMAMALVLAADIWAHLRFASHVDAPVGRLLRSFAGRAVGSLAVGTALLWPLVVWVRGEPPGPDPQLFAFGIGWFLLAITALVALAVSIDYLRVSKPGTPQRVRARAFTWAFGLRDGLAALGVISWMTLDARGLSELHIWSQAISAPGVLFMVALLSYGVLKFKLFDIDLRLKRGISRSTGVALAVVTVFVAAKIAEQYLNRTIGFVAGSIAAGVMLFLAPRLNKLGDKVADAALPKVQPTSAYVMAKKIEVYRAAVEAAVEGGMQERDRQMLDRLLKRLEISPEDAAAVELEVSPAAPASRAQGPEAAKA